MSASGEIPVRILHEDGYIELSSQMVPTFYYYLKDHLGNVRVVFTPNTDNTPAFVQANDYYPFGMVYSKNLPLQGGTGTTTTTTYVNKFLYNGKEEQDMPGKWLDYGARFYDTQLGRWHVIDPMVEEREWLSPYNYCQLNPVNRIDPNGTLDWEPEVDNDGKTNYIAEKGDNKETLKSQYALTEDQASKILTEAKLPQTGDIKEGSKISGNDIKEVTGSEIMKLDWNSSQATEQRIVDQTMFAIKRSQVNGDYSFDLKDFNTNMHGSGSGFNARNVKINVGDEKIPILNVNLTVEWNTKMMSYGQPPKQIFGDNPTTIKQEFRDPSGKFGAPRMLIKMNEEYYEKYIKYYY